MMMFHSVPFLIVLVPSIILAFFVLSPEGDSKKTLENNIAKHVRRLKIMIILEWVILFYGVAIRCTRYYSNPLPLRDCIARYLTMERYSFWELLRFGHSIETMVHDPYGILLIQKMLIRLFGANEYVIQFFPFFCSIVALFLFWKIKDWYVGPSAGILALGLLAASPQLIFYSTIINAYSSDVFVALLLLLLFKKMYHSDLDRRNIILFALAGASSVWFSLPAIFVLAGAMLSFSVDALSTKQTKRLMRFLPVFLVWLLSFAVYYFYALKYFVDNQALLHGWQTVIMPHTRHMGQIFSWFAQKIYEMFVNPLSLYPLLGISMCLLGLWDLFRKKKIKALLLISPVIFMLIAVVFHKYLFWKRVIIFLVPSIYLLAAQGWEFFAVREKRAYHPVLAVILAVLLLLAPVGASFYNFSFRPGVAAFERILDIIQENFQKGDVIYIHNYLGAYYLYYKDRHGLAENPYVIGVDCRDLRCSSDLPKLRPYQRVWYITDVKFGLEVEYVVRELNQVGKCVFTHFKKARCYLFELKQ